MPEYRKVITIVLSNEDHNVDQEQVPAGHHPDQLIRSIEAIRRYVVGTRLPDTLRDVCVMVEPRLRADAQCQLLDLVLFHDGQLPLRFQTRRREGPHAALVEELDRISETLRLELEASNPIWADGAAIVNTEPAPAEEISHLRWKSRRKTPSRPKKSIVPQLLRIAALETPLPLVIPDVRPEYVEPEELEIQAMVTPEDSQLLLHVVAIQYVSSERSGNSALALGVNVRPRVPDHDRFGFIMLASVAGVLNMPLVLRGHAVISNESLRPKAFEIRSILNTMSVSSRFADVLTAQSIAQAAVVQLP